MSEHTNTQRVEHPTVVAPCGCHVPDMGQITCAECLDAKVIYLPPSHYDPPEMPCPYCAPKAYKGGFGGLISPIGTVLIPAVEGGKAPPVRPCR